METFFLSPVNNFRSNQLQEIKYITLFAGYEFISESQQFFQLDIFILITFTANDFMSTWYLAGGKGDIYESYHSIFLISI